jgi:hypothetical protein
MLKPVKKYEAPKYPTLEVANETPEMLKKLPSKWKKKTAVMTCMGFVGLSVLSGSMNLAAEPPEMHHGGDGGMPFYITRPTEQETLAYFLAKLETTELELRTHFGGSASGPFYVVYFTEQEAFGFIRAMLENAGLNFSANPPDYSVEVRDMFMGNYHTFGLDLFDAEKNVAIANVNLRPMRMPPSIAEISKMFAEQYNDITVGVFRNPGLNVFNGMAATHGRWSEDFDEEKYEAEKSAAVAEGKDKARKDLIENLTAQTQQFIDFLYSKGILSSEIAVTLNGAPLRFDVAPVIVNGRTMVPMRTIFEELGFDVEWHDGIITAVNGEKSIQMRIGETEMQINGEKTIALDAAPKIMYGRTLVPLRAVAEATGANVEWDAATQTVRISLR